MFFWSHMSVLPNIIIVHSNCGGGGGVLWTIGWSCGQVILVMGLLGVMVVAV